MTHYLDIRSLPQFGYQVKAESSERQVPISEKLWRRLLAMASEDDTPVFGSPMKSDYHYWQERLAQAAKSAGVPKPQFRDFRNTRAAELIAARTPVNTYASLMGHSARIAFDALRPGDPRRTGRRDAEGPHPLLRRRGLRLSPASGCSKTCPRMEVSEKNGDTCGHRVQ